MQIPERSVHHDTAVIQPREPAAGTSVAATHAAATLGHRAPGSRTRARHLAAHVLALLLAASCSGSSDHASGPPSLVIDFPPPHALTLASEVHVRGRTAGHGRVAEVRVGGAPSSTSDGYRTWNAMVPLTPGPNRIEIDLTDSRGRVFPAVASTEVKVGGILRSPMQIAVDRPRHRALVNNALEGSILAVDLENGEVTPGPWAIDEVDRLAVDEARNRLLATVSQPGTIVAMDLTTGEKSELAGPSRGTGPLPGPPIAVDALQGVALALSVEGALVSLDLETGDRAILSDATHGTGPM